jgi:hypothetical protein
MRYPSEVTLTRPWGGGIAILGAPTAELPDVDPRSPVSLGEGAVVIGVRHAQDFDHERVEGLATATVYVRILRNPEVLSRVVLCDVVLATPDDQIRLGDAEEELVLPAPGPRTRVIISADHVDLTGLGQVWIDLVSAGE